MEKLNLNSLDSFKNGLNKRDKNWIRIGMSTCGIAAGAQEVYNTIVEEVKNRNLDIEISKCGCHGMCYAEPLVEVCVGDLPKVIYGNVDKDTAIKIVDKHAAGQRMVNDHIIEITEG